jgi:hypothetical protein
MPPSLVGSAEGSRILPLKADLPPRTVERMMGVGSPLKSAMSSIGRNPVSYVFAFATLLLFLASVGFWQEHVGAHVLYVASVTSTLQSGLKNSIGIVSGRSGGCTNSTSAAPRNFTCDSFEKEWTAEELDSCPDVKALLQVWESSFYLDESANRGTGFDANWPLPPHLIDCDLVAEQQSAMDNRPQNRALPEWAKGNESAGNPPPETPWVSGTNDNNAPLTRVVQQDLWVQQHPTDCRHPDVRFLVAQWADTVGWGVGSQLHLMTGALAVAVMTGRVLVLEDYWERANHEGCVGESKGKLDCYFFPVAAPECAEIALGAKPRNERYVDTQWDAMAKVLNRDEQVVFMPISALGDRQIIDIVPSIWGEPWKTGAGSIEYEGKMVDETAPLDYGAGSFGPMNWWRAQATRYFLRFPTPYLCRIINRVQHEEFGVEVAARVVQSMRFQKEHSPRKIGFTQYGQLERTLWQNEVFMPRPIVSVHVRHGKDKAREMNIIDLPAFMEQVERIRQHNPAVRSIWLSTESQDIVDQSGDYGPWWRVYYTKTKRIFQEEPDPWNTHTPNREELDLAFANLLIASRADYFVGVLGSNWNRLIDELRKTNGRLKAGYIALNYDQV